MEIYTFETLYSKDKNGKVKTWKLSVEKYEKYSEIVTLYGYNRTFETRRQINSGKNLQKSNETTHYEQAILEAKSKWLKKKEIEQYTSDNTIIEHSVDDNLIENMDKLIIGNPLPMLANDYKKHEEKVKILLNDSKVMIQRKLDGFRMIYNTTTNLITTRQGKEYSIIKQSGKLYKELLKLPKGYIFDGELYSNKINFETLGVLRKTKKLTEKDIINLDKIEYHIYDLINLTLSFEKRNEKIKEILQENIYEKLIYVDTYNISSKEQIKEYHTTFLKEGFEGLMIRNKDSLYKIKYRSNDLLKYKDFEDAEFNIIDFTLEKDISGKDQNLVVWIIMVNQNITCKVRPKGTKEERQELYKKCIENFNQFKDRKLWTTFFEYTDAGSLRFPSTKTNTYESYIRDDIL